MARYSVELLKKNKVDDFGALLNDAWKVKKSLSDNISNPHIDEMYETALTSGALGGKILGAGGGGYLLVYVPEQNQNRVQAAMSKYETLDFQFTDTGSSVEMHS
jgi:D-glycero-alpha-D-manno-heptose-7-phosphate kinase